jgi:hypothetical protein
MVQLPRNTWSPQTNPNPNEYHLVTFDPGAAATGWAHFVVDAHAFSRPEARVLRWLISWDCGEFTGHENVQCGHAQGLMATAKYSGMGEYNRKRIDFVTEDFDLVQMVGGKNLLSPVRINAVLDWECAKLGSTLQYQNRALRTNITPERLNLFGFDGKWSKSGKGKDAFAAMQHAVVWLRRTKLASRSRPWKLSDGIVHNAVWDCSCAHMKIVSAKRFQHNLTHP